MENKETIYGNNKETNAPYQSSCGENKAGCLWEQHTQMQTPVWVVHQTTLPSSTLQTVSPSRAPWRSLLTLRTGGNSKVLNFFNSCRLSCCFSSRRAKNRAQWIRKCWSLFFLVRGAPSHPVLFFWCFQVPASIQQPVEREGQREQVPRVNPEPTGQWEAIGRWHWWGVLPLMWAMGGAGVHVCLWLYT